MDELDQLLKKLGLSVARGVPQLATGFIDLAGLPLTLTGMQRPEDIVGSTAYLTERGFLPPPQTGLLNETAELISSAVSPAGLAKTSAGLLTAGMIPVVKKQIDNLPVASAMTKKEAGNDRLKRAKEMGFNVDKPVFHGSTFDISRFGGDKNPEGAFGSGYYFTSNPKDASVNYTEGGADLESKITLTAERMEADGLPPEVAQTKAKKEIMGQAGSVVYPVYLREGKVFDLRKGKSSYLESEYPDPFEQDPDYWLRQTDGNIEEARELAEEDRFMSEPSGAFVDFYKSVTSHPDMSSDDRAMAGTVLGDYLVEGISSKNLEKVWNEIEMYPENEAGQFTKSEVFRQGIEDAGFDSIKHDANRFKGMEEVQGTEHTIIFNPKNVRSINADFDPEKIEELDILSQLQRLSKGLA